MYYQFLDGEKRNSMQPCSWSAVEIAVNSSRFGVGAVTLICFVVIASVI